MEYATDSFAAVQYQKTCARRAKVDTPWNISTKTKKEMAASGVAVGIFWAIFVHWFLSFLNGYEVNVWHSVCWGVVVAVSTLLLLSALWWSRRRNADFEMIAIFNPAVIHSPDDWILAHMRILAEEAERRPDL